MKSPFAKPTLAQLPQGLTTLYLLFMLTGFVLFCGPSGYLAITAAKYRMFVIATLCYWGLLLGCAACLLRTRQIARPRLGQLWRGASITQKAVLLWLLLCCLSAACSAYPGISWYGAGRYEGLATLLLYGGSFLVLSHLGKAKSCYLYALAVTVAVNCGIALWQMEGGNPFGLYPAGYTYFDANLRYSGEFLGTIGNADLFSAFLALAIPLLTLYAAKIAAPRLRWLLLAVAVLAACTLAKAGVAAGPVGLLGCIVLTLPLACGKTAQSRKQLYGGMALLCLAGLAALYCFGGRLGGTAGELAALLHGQIADEFGSSRIKIWRQTLALVPDGWLLGGGPDTLAVRLNLLFSRYLPETGQTLQVQVDAAHNEYLNYLVNIGLPGLLAYLTALTASAIGWFRQGTKNPVVLLLGGGVLAYCIQGFFCFSLCPVAPLFWLCWGVLEHTLHHTATPHWPQAAPDHP